MDQGRLEGAAKQPKGILDQFGDVAATSGDGDSD